MKDEGEKASVALDTPQFKQLISVIRDLVKVFAAAQIKPEESTEKNARFLRVFGLSQQEIADILGVTQPTVNEALTRSKKKQRKGKGNKHGTSENPSE